MSLIVLSFSSLLQIMSQIFTIWVVGFGDILLYVCPTVESILDGFEDIYIHAYVQTAS